MEFQIPRWKIICHLGEIIENATRISILKDSTKGAEGRRPPAPFVEAAEGRLLYMGVGFHVFGQPGHTFPTFLGSILWQFNFQHFNLKEFPHVLFKML